MIYNKLTVDQACQLEQQAGNESARLIDELMNKMAAVEEITGVELPEDDGTYYLTCTIADGAATFAWAALPAEQPAEQTVEEGGE